MTFFNTIPGSMMLLIIGFIFLVKGADFFVDGASNVAKRLKVPSLIIGLTIVSIGTSLPETAVSISAAMNGSNSLAISNVTGSNIFNLMVVVGVCALMQTIAVDKETIKRDIPLSLLAAILMLVFGFTKNVLGLVEGLILFAVFVAYIITMIRSAMKSRKESEENDATVSQSVLMSIICIVGGAIGVAVGGNWVVSSASTLAMALGMTETLVGLTIVAVGTSLPELVTSVVAAKKNDVDMALGNAIGSSIFNIFFVIGLSGIISPIAFIQANVLDILVLIAFTILVWMLIVKDCKITRKKGFVMVFAYVAYMAYIIIRDMM